MSQHSAQHGDFTIERDLDFSVATVFAAWADPAAKKRWFAAPHDCKENIREQDFRVGGRDRLQATWPNGRVSHFSAEYWDIVPNERIVYVYEMHLNGKKISVSLATVQFIAKGKGTRLIVTEQGAFLDGYDDAGAREEGTKGLLDQFEASLKNN